MSYCPDCGYGIGSQGHHDCCVTKKSTHTRNGNRINMDENPSELECFEGLARQGLLSEEGMERLEELRREEQ